jgi:cytochrome c553
MTRVRKTFGAVQGRLVLAVLGVWSLVAAPSGIAADAEGQAVAQSFVARVQPLLKTYCFGCHGDEKQEAKLKLSDYSTPAAVARDYRLWELVRRRL